MDESVSGPIFTALCRLGIDALAANSDGLKGAEDTVVLERAIELERVLVTCDNGFFQIAADWINSGQHFIGIIYVPKLAPHGPVLRDLELLVQACDLAEFRDFIWRLPFPS